MNKYIRIMRLDHWIKQLFIIPGSFFALVLLPQSSNVLFFKNFIIGFIATSLVASANYVINEWLDAEFDKYHPEKKNRSIVQFGANKYIVYSLYFILSIFGILLSLLISTPFLITEIWLLIMGILYNVKPFRTKDIAYIDVLTESINNAIRLLLGWFIVTSSFYPPISLVVGYWFAGAFLMATKRFAEYRMIDNPELAGKYRKSFQHYSLNSLMLSSFFYAICSNFFIGIFLVKYKIELLLFIPFLIGMFCYYFNITFKKDSAAQKPEKLFHEHGLMIYVVILIILFIILMMIHIPLLDIFVRNTLVSI